MGATVLERWGVACWNANAGATEDRWSAGWSVAVEGRMLTGDPTLACRVEGEGELRPQGEVWGPGRGGAWFCSRAIRRLEGQERGGGVSEATSKPV